VLVSLLVEAEPVLVLELDSHGHFTVLETTSLNHSFSYSPSVDLPLLLSLIGMFLIEVVGGLEIRHLAYLNEGAARPGQLDKHEWQLSYDFVGDAYCLIWIELQEDRGHSLQGVEGSLLELDNMRTVGRSSFSKHH